MKGPNDYTVPCPENGVSHDCTHEYLMWWNRDAFNEWLRIERARAWWDGVNDQWRLRPRGNRLPETYNPHLKDEEWLTR